MRDCSEIYRGGQRAPGFYSLDTSGQYHNNDLDEVYCNDGWTRILRRNPTSDDFEDVRASSCYNVR